ncbi:MAG: potassium transporter Kup [Gammaproteobacteria bacterium CG_4_10_14_0_8_um_filter_38_16]|nr:MAG: potassium transporter Kup [Gammaproteobacteria bacterium CG_4_10_14_0_8_um_filter_38_16]PJA02761.1 MAG: potassium transporter Kup [Gammaproteobacteria bacterium CG_4_10_14_0_2_um_filter_38_22]
MDQHKLSNTQGNIFSLSLAALGVVYGDIGTSPLYAIRASLTDLPVNATDVLGALSLILWALILVVSIKYLCVVLKADNEGEGGILVLLTLLLKNSNNKTRKIYFILAIFGAGLMLGDGMLTPAISVLSSAEGLKVISPFFSPWVVPLSCIILLLLFFFQFVGTEKIGFTFGPVIFIWFGVLGVLGLLQIIQNPIVLEALDPYFAFEFFRETGWQGYAILGGVFLVVTGGEALYTDLGHFGKNPIRLGWFAVALPGLLLNYFGQAAYLLMHPDGISNPFFLMAPPWFLITLFVIATCATVIASQAVISATFSLTKQAVLLGLYPRIPIIQTSDKKRGQIYIPQVNMLLVFGTLLLVLIFKTSNSLAHAYGIAVNLDMLLTTLLVAISAYRIWHWNKFFLFVLFSIFMLIDGLFFGANVGKILTGGWMPIGFALLCAFVMYTWKSGMAHLRLHFYSKKENLSVAMRAMKTDRVNALSDFTTIFITDVYDKSVGGFVDFIKLNHILPKNILIISYAVENIPYVVSSNRFELFCLDENTCQLTLHYGFMDFISIPQALRIAVDRNLLPFLIDLNEVTYLIENPNIVASRQRKTLHFFWQEKLFEFLIRNYSAAMNIEFYQLPHNRTISIGTYCVI